TELNTNFTPWLERSREHGYRSSMATPLRVHGQVIGSLNVYAAMPGAFGSQEVVLLEKLAVDIGLAVERLRAIDRIAASEHELATILQNMQDTYYRTDQDGRIVRASESATRLLGYAPEEVLGMRLADFYVDADGRERFLAALQAANGTLRNFEAALRHRDGSVTWVSTNAQFVRDAEGKVIGIEGTTRDITDRKRAEDRLLDIARGVSATTGETFFHTLVAHLVQSLQADYAFVGQLTPEQDDRIRTIAAQAGDKRIEDFEYDLAGTPCQNVVGRETCAYPRAVQDQFPSDHMLAEMGVHAYVGTPLFSSNGAALGLLVVLYRRPIDEDLTIRTTLEIFAARAAAELERLRAELALRESEIMLARAQEMTHLGSWRWQVVTGKVTWSDEMYRIYGVSPDMGEVSFERAMAAMHPDDRALVTQQVQDMLAGKDTENYEYRIVRPDGVVRNVWARSEVQRAADGSPLFVIGTVQDITNHKRAEQALRDSETRYRTIVETAQEGIWQIDADSRTSYVNRKMAEILGYTVAEMQGRSLLDFMDEEGRAMVAYNVERRKQGIAEQHEFKFQHKDGATVWAELNTTPQHNADGSYAGALAMVTDITERRRAEMALRESEAKYRQLFENMTSGFALHEIICDAEGKPVDYRYLQANPAFEKLTGVPIANLVGKRIREILPDTEDYWIQIFGKVALTREPMAYENFSRELGKYYDTWAFSPQENQFAVIFTDITKRKLAEAEMLKLSSALEQTADSVVITDRQGTIEYVNPGFEKTTGYSRDEALGQTPRLVKSGKQGAGFYKKLWDTILAGDVYSEVFVNRRKDGGLYYEEKTISPLKDAAGQVTHFVATGKDVTERMQTQERLQHMAQHDALTELPNRALFLDRLKQALARARWHKRLVAVLFVDMDRFKTINDTLGHEIGDKLLQALAERFSVSVREGDTVARFGGDEFVVLLDDVASEKDIGALAQKVIEMLAPPFEIGGQSLYITASIGVSMYPNDGEDSTTLLKNADIAMYRAKDLGKNTYQFYSADMSARAFERLTLESSLRHAIERNEFRLYYQPQIDAASGAILGVEALLRWQHPDFGLVAPAEFIPLLEETGLIVPVGDWVFRTACEQLCAWHVAGWPTLRMAVNLSPRQFQAAGLA
ncbi:MAG: response regulator, partial [Proteobacteria bacterium]|nr:response regulator [Pseudomonadota bacterium]